MFVLDDGNHGNDDGDDDDDSEMAQSDCGGLCL